MTGFLFYIFIIALYEILLTDIAFFVIPIAKFVSLVNITSCKTNIKNTGPPRISPG